MNAGGNEMMFKIIISGDSGTGKSSLVTRYLKDSFHESHHATVGVQYSSKKIQIDQNCFVKLQIWDTAGQERFRSIVRSFYLKSSAVVLVYDITRKQTFQSLKNWLLEARESCPKTAIFILLGTHLDLQDQREVSKEEAEKWMEEEEIVMFFETSSKTAINVAKAFEELGKQLFLNQLSKRGETMTSFKKNVRLSQPKEKSDSVCC